jgi:hypothetical protein
VGEWPQNGDLPRKSAFRSLTPRLPGEALAQMKVDSLPSAEDIAGRQDGLRLNREEARRQRQALDGAIDAQNTILSNVADARGQLGGTLTEIQNRLEADLAILPDSDRLSLVAAADKAVKDAQGDYRIKAAALEEQRQKAPSVEELERQQNRVTRLLNALDNQKTRLGTLDREISKDRYKMPAATALGKRSRSCGKPAN